MYEVFFESGRIVFTRDKHFGAGTLIMVEREQDLWDVFIRWTQSVSKEDLILVSDHPSAAFRRFSIMFELIEAAGGLLSHPGGAFLFIFRNGKWDLPKGKVDEGETTEQTAIREVEEECGLNGIRISGELSPGFHVYKGSDEKWMLKKTTWYLMEIPRVVKPVPQKSEGIEAARWFMPEDFPGIMDNAYPIVSRLIQQLPAL